jgi:hypothetical protein
VNQVLQVAAALLNLADDKKEYIVPSDGKIIGTEK